MGILTAIMIYEQGNTMSLEVGEDGKTGREMKISGAIIIQIDKCPSSPNYSLSGDLTTDVFV